MLRHKNLLTERSSQNIKRARAEKTEDEVELYFKNLGVTIKDVPPERILNYDETNLSDNSGATKHVFRRGTKYSERIMNNKKSAISIMHANGASQDPEVQGTIGHNQAGSTDLVFLIGLKPL